MRYGLRVQERKVKGCGKTWKDEIWHTCDNHIDRVCWCPCGAARVNSQPDMGAETTNKGDAT